MNAEHANEPLERGDSGVDRDGMSRPWPLAWMAAGVLAPWLIAQGRQVRRNTPELPEPVGERCGHWHVPWPCELPPARPLACSLDRGGRASRLRLLLLGDSSMAGVGAAHQSEALSGALARELAPEPNSVRVDWQIAARTGLRTREMSAALPGLLQASASAAMTESRAVALDRSDAAKAERFDLALVALGVNDATALQSAGAFRRDVQALRQRLRERHGIRRILWSGLPPIHRFPALPQPLRAVLGRKAIELDAVLREFGADYAPMPAHLDDDWIATDGFHPGPRAYAAWAAQLAPQLSGALGQLAD